jgi:hypothetical protein
MRGYWDFPYFHMLCAADFLRRSEDWSASLINLNGIFFAFHRLQEAAATIEVAAGSIKVSSPSYPYVNLKITF